MSRYKRFAFMACLLLLISNGYAQEKVYVLLDKTPDADIDKTFILRLNETRPGLSMLDSLFRPIKGEFTVYRFLATFRGKSYTGVEKEFHDLLMVKTDAQGKVIKAYQYTLEWAEPSFESDIYISTSKGLVLTNGLSVSAFGFERPWFDDPDKKLKDSGYIRYSP